MNLFAFAEFLYNHGWKNESILSTVAVQKTKQLSLEESFSFLEQEFTLQGKKILVISTFMVWRI
jgi:hypothetical protein